MCWLLLFKLNRKVNGKHIGWHVKELQSDERLGDRRAVILIEY